METLPSLNDFAFLSYIMAMILVVSILPRTKKVQTVVRFIFIYCRLFIGYLELAGWLGHVPTTLSRIGIMSSYDAYCMHRL